ncbi:MAG: hypothetical protein ACOCRX_06120 [Candidatus Woesearchaeota archaeon]
MKSKEKNRGKIVICASLSFEKEIKEWKEKLEKLGFKVIKHPIKLQDDFVEDYKEEFSKHYKAILESDAILVLNFKKNKIPGYIGAGVFAEMAFAIGLNKTLNKQIKVYYLNPIPKDKLSCSDELELWQKLNWIEQFKIN